MVDKYIPKQGDIVFVDFNPTLGHEQTGYRPGVVVSNNTFNLNTKMAIVCPISTNTKEFPTHYLLKDSKSIKGCVLCEHIKSIDYQARHVRFVEKTTDDDFENILELIEVCLIFD